MSELQRARAKAKLNSLDGFPEMMGEEEQDEEMDGLGDLPEGLDDDSSSASSASSASSTGTVIPSPSQRLFARPHGITRGGSRNLEQIPWTTYFERELFLTPPDNSLTFHAYLNSPTPGLKAPLFVLHHGAGSSGMSFAVLASEIRKHLPNAGILSPDARGHGGTTYSSPSAAAAEASNSTTTVVNSTPIPLAPTNQSQPPQQKPATHTLDLETLTNDLHCIITATAQRMSWPELPPVILVGHSLGGAVITNLAARGSLGQSLIGFCVLDVVEGSAMDALSSMLTYLSTRPPGFETLAQGIEWHLRSRTLRNAVSARTSVPALLARDEDADPRRPWRWRTDLAATQPFWEGWFVGLSKKFLSSRGGKLLVLAGTDRLDTELTIGQMQGKYALQVFPEAGHFIHEDIPDRIALLLADFYRRNDRSALVLPPKVSELLKQGKKV